MKLFRTVFVVNFFAAISRCLALPQQQSPPPSDILAIQNVTLISPERAAPLNSAYVIIAGDRIRVVGAGQPNDLPINTHLIDGKGLFLIPGLIDAHVHLAGIPGVNRAHERKLPEVVKAYRRQLPRSYLYFGFTTVIDLNVINRSTIDKLKAAPIAPDIYDCDCALAIANGYTMNFLPPKKRFEVVRNFIYDPRQADSIPKKFKPEDHTPVATVKRVKEAGGICVKTHFEPGFGAMRGKLPTPTKEMLAEIITESHKRNLTVTMHANSFQAHKFATEVGVDVIVHGLWNWSEFDNAQEIPPPIKQVLDQIVANKIGFMATTQVIAGLQALYAPEFLNDPHLSAILPVALIDWYRSAEGRWYAEELQRDDFDGLEESGIRQRFDFILNRCHQIIRYLAANKANLLFGSDTPSAPTYGNPPGYNGYLEMKHLASAGATPRQILAAATINNAMAFHLDSLYGTIEAGKVANLLLLKQNPLETVEAYDAIDTVILRGKVLQRTDLSMND